ncbi:MAG: aminodeoxychorismate/anthranilate synthase component II [Myxococcota bacterium]|nr:aminodeoxychorismate/anthranilate synthase component II [Myxococcota bacterium]
MHVFVLDNYDSFTYNLVQYLEVLGAKTTTVRNNAIEVDEIESLRPDLILLSPGPGRPSEAGIMPELIKHVSGHIPLLGVCLGHQAIGEAFGASLTYAAKPLHGVQDNLLHAQHPIFKGLPSPLPIGRYHSLILRDVKAPLLSVAWSPIGEVMALVHQTWPIVGLQFHPESILSVHGHRLLENVLLYLCPALMSQPHQ